MIFDKIIIGAGLYGLYAALYCGRRGQRVLVLEYDDAPFKRATYINQARVHNGYHYPRSISTAVKSRGYFDRFNEDYGFCVNNKFEQVYATSSKFSWTSAAQFKKFCSDADIRCDEMPPGIYFKQGLCDGAFLTMEYTFDAQILKNYFIDEIAKYNNIKIIYNSRINIIKSDDNNYIFELADGENYKAGFVLNATYAGVNQIHAMLGFPALNIKYELCEIIICEVGEKLKNTGVTVMDGAFFSIMPFGKTGLHSLTSVTFTPHITSYNSVPDFACQARSNGLCSPEHLANCNNCPAKPESAWVYMSHLARKYLRDEYSFGYRESLYSVKPILKASEIDDSRPTVIRKYSDKPIFISVLSGKINTVYELDEELN